VFDLLSKKKGKKSGVFLGDGKKVTILTKKEQGVSALLMRFGT